eukprot:2384044-Pleurochrysis_carterae.AAC.4
MLLFLPGPQVTVGSASLKWNAEPPTHGVENFWSDEVFCFVILLQGLSTTSYLTSLDHLRTINMTWQPELKAELKRGFGTGTAFSRSP